MDLSHWIERNARFAPTRTAIRFASQDISYAALASRIDRAAAALEHAGVREGEVVAYLGLNHPIIIELLFACARLDALVAPLNWRLARPEIRRTLEDCRPRILIAESAFIDGPEAVDVPADTRRIRIEPSDHADGPCWESFLAEVPAGASCTCRGGPDSPLVLCYTSGTAGVPKGVVLDQNALLTNALNSAHMHDLTSRDHILTTTPMFHVGGFNILTLPALHAGASVTIHARFDPQATLDTIEREQVTLVVLVPAQLTAILDMPTWNPAQLRSLRMITTGSTIITEQFARKINSFGIPLAQVYGSTETGPAAAYQRAGDAMLRPGSAGAPALHCEIRIVDAAETPVAAGEDGEILVRGCNVMRGYWNRPELTANALRNGWYHTGDVGHLDQDGYLYVVTRKRDMIISGGENVYPEEVESVLVEMLEIKEVCIFGIPHHRLGEQVTAAIVLREGTVLTAASVSGYLTNRLARYKHPRAVHFVTCLPRTSLGKVIRSEVRKSLVGDASGVPS
ncbi:MAG: AMP-binding protein [Proteobacteria bacterium]|nr:AMP-binding protein [Pseudomonadota bacterium]